MDNGTEQRAPRRRATITRRAGLTLGMAAALAGAGVVAAATPALVVKTHETAPSDNGGVVRQEYNVFEYDFATVGSRVRVYAEIRTRCGGDDVPRTVYVGAINTTS